MRAWRPAAVMPPGMPQARCHKFWLTLQGTLDLLPCRRGARAGGLLRGPVALHQCFHLSRLTTTRLSFCRAEEACALEACYVAAFRMKRRGLVLHEKLDKAAVR